MKPETLHKLSYGMYIVSSKDDGKLNGQIANTVFQITAEPPTIAVSINKQNLTHDYITTSQLFTVSVLAKETPLSFIGQFGFKSGRDLDKFAGVKYLTGKLGAPVVLDNTVAYLEAEVVDEFDCGTHTVFLARIKEAETLPGQAEPLTYAYYHEVKRGTSPATAPTYLKSEETIKEPGMKKYVCKVCGYVYEPEKGDPDAKIAAGTAFEGLPATWVCPVCGEGKDQFEAVK
ncbi:MAG: flavin reductase [Candidatus Margulisiibacteriota bacterium]